MTCWVLRAAGNRRNSPSTLHNGLALAIDLQRRAESHQETVPSRRDEIIAGVTRLESTRTRVLDYCSGKRAGREGDWDTPPFLPPPANHKHIGSRTERGANSLRGWRGKRIVIELRKVSSTCVESARRGEKDSHRRLC